MWPSLAFTSLRFLCAGIRGVDYQAQWVFIDSLRLLKDLHFGWWFFCIIVYFIDFFLPLFLLFPFFTYFGVHVVLFLASYNGSGLRSPLKSYTAFNATKLSQNNTLELLLSRREALRSNPSVATPSKALLQQHITSVLFSCLVIKNILQFLSWFYLWPMSYGLYSWAMCT
jgi:hypothetical protein